MRSNPLLRLALVCPLLFLTTSGPAQQPVSPADADSVRLLITVRTRRGDPVEALAPGDLRIFEKGAPAGRVAGIEKIANPRLQYCVLFDLNREGDWMLNLQSAAATQLLEDLIPADEKGSLFMFSVRSVMPLQVSARRMQQEIASAAVQMTLGTRGAPALYENMHNCADRLARTPAEARVPAMFVFTGQRDILTPQLNDVAHLALRTGTRVFLFHVARGDTRDSRVFRAQEKIAAYTGGTAFEYVSLAEFGQIVQEVREYFRDLFVVTYVPPPEASRDGLYHGLDFVTDRPFKVGAPFGYYGGDR